MPSDDSTSRLPHAGPDLEERLAEARMRRKAALAGTRTARILPEKPWDEDPDLPELIDESALSAERLRAAQVALGRSDRLALAAARQRAAEVNPDRATPAPGAPRPLRFLSTEQRAEDPGAAEIGRDSETGAPLLLENPLLAAPKRPGSQPPKGSRRWLRRLLGGFSAQVLAAVLAGALCAGAPGIARGDAHTAGDAAGQTVLPELSETGVVVQAPDSVSQTDLELLSAVVSDAGFDAPVLSRSGVTTSANHIRFYYPEDIAAAAKLAEITGAEIRDFTTARARPETRVVELWLEGRSAGGGGQRSTGTRDVFKPIKRLERSLDKLFGGN